MAENVLSGSCLCGAVTYEVRPPFLRFAHCHCRRCRKATGSGHASNLYVAPTSFRWTSGAEAAVRFDLPAARSFATTFCKSCGSPLPHHTRSGREVVVPAGSLDGVPDIAPQARIFWESRAGWTCGDRLPRFAEYPPWWQPLSGRRLPGADDRAR
ncbi:MAG: GFA family protein [Candidatus Binatia bacterium]